MGPFFCSPPTVHVQGYFPKEKKKLTFAENQNSKKVLSNSGFKKQGKCVFVHMGQFPQDRNLAL